MKPGTGMRGIGLAGYLIFALSIVLMFVVASGMLRKSRPAAPAFALPAELRKIECPKDPQGRAQGDDFVRVAGTVVALRCLPPGTMKDAEKAWKQESDIDRMAFDIVFTKSPDARFLAGSSGTLQPKAEQARYVVETRVRLHPFRPFQSPMENRLDISVPTPPAFAAAGAETRFECSRPVGNGQACLARLQSRSLYWGVKVMLGWPYPKSEEWQRELAEALDLVAAHVVKQE
jgi:hypothetical protein